MTAPAFSKVTSAWDVPKGMTPGSDMLGRSLAEGMLVITTAFNPPRLGRIVGLEPGAVILELPNTNQYTFASINRVCIAPEDLEERVARDGGIDLLDEVNKIRFLHGK